MSIKDKLTSRKFWICVAAFLGSVATSISGIVTDNKYVTTIGVVAGILSTAIYSFCEAWVDGKSVTRKNVNITRHVEHYCDDFAIDNSNDEDK